MECVCECDYSTLLAVTVLIFTF